MEEVTSVLSLASGPAGGLIVCFSILWWIGNRALPVFQKYLEDQNQTLRDLVTSIDTTVQEHKKDRAVFEQAISNLSVSIQSVDERLAIVESEVEETRGEITDVKERLKL
jgi:chromosome segregation ATPase